MQSFIKYLGFNLRYLSHKQKYFLVSNPILVGLLVGRSMVLGSGGNLLARFQINSYD